MTDFQQPILTEQHMLEEQNQDHTTNPYSALDQDMSESFEPQSSSKSKDNEQLVCQWNNCMREFPDHPSLASHLSEDHVGWKKGGYYCDWNNCARQGAKCHNRFALMMHLRIHTGEKPFECKIPDCGQTFGRMDALVRHKKIEHGEGALIAERPIRASHSAPYQPKKTLGVKRSSALDSLPRSKKSKYSGIRRWPSNSLQTSTDWSSGDELDEPQIKMSPRQPVTPGSDYSQYRLARAQLHYILRENEMLQDEYETTQKKLKRMKTERKVLLEAVMAAEHNQNNNNNDRKHQGQLEEEQEEEIDVMTEENEDSMIPADDI